MVLRYNHIRSVPAVSADLVKKVIKNKKKKNKLITLKNSCNQYSEKPHLIYGKVGLQG